jgi:nicotinamide-nucleotide amidase
MFPAEIIVLARTLLEEARNKSLHIATAESSTGGLIAAAITEISGSSDAMDRGFVVYTNRAKTELLGVPEQSIAKHGAVSAATARAMVEGALANSHADLAVSCTGIAGPAGGTAEKPIGLVHLAVARKGHNTIHLECRFGDIGRSQVRMKSLEAALKLLLQALRES